MEELIKKILSQMKAQFIAFWILPVLLILLGETGSEWVGMYADNVRTIYIFETTTILLTAICVPISLKLFAWVLINRIDKKSIINAIRLYVFWSGIRLLLLSLPVLMGFMVYYLTLSNKGVLCAFIALTASLFCLPSEKRIRKELQIDKEEL